MKVNETTLALALAGDRAAAADLIESAWPDAYRIAWAALRDSPAAEDAAQEACARAWGRLGSVRHADRFAAWFYRIVVNECRRRKRLQRRDLQLVEQSLPPAVERLDESIDVRRAIEALPGALRLVVVLRYYCDFTAADIASVMRCSPVTVRWRLMLAHRRIREALDTVGKEPGSETVAFG